VMLSIRYHTHIAKNVSIRTRPFGRVMHEAQTVFGADGAFQSAPGLSAG